MAFISIIDFSFSRLYLTWLIDQTALLASDLMRIMFTAAWKRRILSIHRVFHLIRARDNLQLL